MSRLLLFLKGDIRPFSERRPTRTKTAFFALCSEAATPKSAPSKHAFASRRPFFFTLPVILTPNIFTKPADILLSLKFH